MFLKKFDGFLILKLLNYENYVKLTWQRVRIGFVTILKIVPERDCHATCDVRRMENEANLTSKISGCDHL